MITLNQVKQWVKLRSLYSSIQAYPHFKNGDKNEMFTDNNDSLKQHSSLVDIFITVGLLFYLEVSNKWNTGNRHFALTAAIRIK